MLYRNIILGRTLKTDIKKCKYFLSKSRKKKLFSKFLPCILLLCLSPSLTHTPCTPFTSSFSFFFVHSNYVANVSVWFKNWPKMPSLHSLMQSPSSTLVYLMLRAYTFNHSLASPHQFRSLFRQLISHVSHFSQVCF